MQLTIVLGRVTRKYPHLVLIPALSSGRVLVLNSGTRPGTTIYWTSDKPFCEMFILVKSAIFWRSISTKNGNFWHQKKCKLQFWLFRCIKIKEFSTLRRVNFIKTWIILLSKLAKIEICMGLKLFRFCKKLKTLLQYADHFSKTFWL